jgi:hypothetical protein
MTHLQRRNVRRSARDAGQIPRRICYPWILAAVVAIGCGAVIVATPPPARAGGVVVVPVVPVTVVYAHDIHVDSIVASVIYAHDVHAAQLQYRELILIEGDPGGGGQDIKGGSIQAREIRAHDIHARSIVVDVLYAHKVH